MKFLLTTIALLLTAIADAADYSKAECPEYARLLNEPGGGLVVVSAKWCPACRRLEAQLVRDHIPFVLVDVDRHPRTVLGFLHTTIPQVFLVTRSKRLRPVLVFPVLRPSEGDLR
jgi:glutaredoxin